MKRLPDNFRPALDEIKKTFVYKDSNSFHKLTTMWNKVNKVFNKYNCENPDINNVISNYQLDNEYGELIGKLKRLTASRNKCIAKKAFNSDNWKSFIHSMKKEMSNVLNKELHTRDVNKGVLAVMKNYKNDWNGFWTIVDISNNGTINKLSMFDIEDLKCLRDNIISK